MNRYERMAAGLARGSEGSPFCSEEAVTVNVEEADCIVAGLICLDIIPDVLGQADFLEAIRPGHLVAIGAPTMAPGGAVANTGLALHKFGISTRLMGKIGDDTYGAVLRRYLESIDNDLVQEMRVAPDEHTSYTIILSPPDSDRIFLHSTGANETFGAGDIDYEALCGARLFHFGYPTAMARMLANNGMELASMLKRAKETGITTSLDTSMFDRRGLAGKTDWQVLLSRALPYVDIFLPSLDELLLMVAPDLQVGGPDPELCRSLAGDLLQKGTKMVMIKQGQNGLYLRTGEALHGHDLGRAFADDLARWTKRELWAPAFQVSVVGTTGAGDCAVGGFLAALLRGYGPDQALIMSAAAGACNVEAADATSGLRTWTEMERRITGGWRQYQIDLPDWFFDQKSKLWHSAADSRIV
jgi:sugar/nucleoside kinase (ribokinase family)